MTHKNKNLAVIHSHILVVTLFLSFLAMNARNCYVFFFCNEIKKRKQTNNKIKSFFVLKNYLLTSHLKYFFNRISSSKRQEII